MGETHEPGDLVGTTEAAALFGVRPPNFIRDWASRPDFPAPLATLAATRVWSRRDLEAYLEQDQAGPRWPPRRPLHLTPDAERWLPTIKRRVVRGFHPTAIVLFGSQARGHADRRSDIDLLVVVPEVDSRRRLAADIYNSLRGIPVATDIAVVAELDVDRYRDVVGTIIRPALEEGALLYARS